MGTENNINPNHIKYSLEERREIYARPVNLQFLPVFMHGEAVVLKHIIKSSIAEDYPRVFDVAKALSIYFQSPVYILPEINACEQDFRNLLGLSNENGCTPDIMLSNGVFVDVKSPQKMDKLARNAGKASRQSAIACITDHRLHLEIKNLDLYAQRVFGNDAYIFDTVYFFIQNHLYKKTKERHPWSL